MATLGDTVFPHIKEFEIISENIGLYEKICVSKQSMMILDGAVKR